MFRHLVLVINVILVMVKLTHVFGYDDGTTGNQEV